MTVDSTGSTTPAQTAGTSAVAPSVNQDEFLTLLVAQIKNQDPTNPTDSTTFVTQLAQFSQLEQVIAIRGDIESQISQNSGGSTKATGTQGGN
jgi:flagellar basal-body rod modification protein FlgD